LGTWSFRARLGGIYARPHVRARAAAGGGGRPVPVPGSGLGLGSGSGSGSLPGLVLFESGLRVWVSGSEPTRSKTVGIPTVATVGLPTVVTVGCILWAANRHDCWVERVQPFIGFEPVGPSCRLYKALLTLN